MAGKYKFPSDFFKTCQVALEPEILKFDENCKKINSELRKSKSFLDEGFGGNSCKCPPSKACRDDETQIQKVFEDISELQSFRKNVKYEIQRMIQQANLSTSEIDFELLGRSNKEQNEILTQRLSTLEKTKELTQKVLKHLLIELDNYQKKIDPMIEGDVLKYLVESRKNYASTIELQLNREVKRLEENFSNKWIETSKSKRKYDKIDWELRTELQPKIVRLKVASFQRSEQLRKVNSEIQEVTKQIEEQETRDEEIEKDFAALTSKFDELSTEAERFNVEAKHLKIKIKIAVKAIYDENETFRGNLIDANENNLISVRVKEIYKDELDSELDKCCSSFDDTKLDCIIAALTKEICKVSRNIRESKIQESKLQKDIKHLMDGDEDEVIGRDYLGGNFVKLVGPECS